MRKCRGSARRYSFQTTLKNISESQYIVLLAAHRPNHHGRYEEGMSEMSKSVASIAVRKCFWSLPYKTPKVLEILSSGVTAYGLTKKYLAKVIEFDSVTSRCPARVGYSWLYTAAKICQATSGQSITNASSSYLWVKYQLSFSLAWTSR